MDMLSVMIRRDYPILLNLGVYCTKHLKFVFKAEKESLESRYIVLLEGMLIRGLAVDEENITILHDYTYALWQLGHDPEATINYAAWLWTSTIDLCRSRAELGSLQYTTITQAFAFSVELPAIRYLAARRAGSAELSRDRELAFLHMNDVIEILRRCDLECQVKAAWFSKKLARWYLDYLPGHKTKIGEAL